MKKNDQELWITNISKAAVSLRDLALTIQPYKSINLLSKHFKYSIEEIEKSINYGSIKTKSDRIKIRKVAPQIIIKPGIYISKDPLELKLRSAVKIENKNLNDLLEEDNNASLSDQKYILDLINEDENDEGKKNGDEK